MHSLWICSVIGEVRVGRLIFVAELLHCFVVDDGAAPADVKSSFFFELAEGARLKTVTIPIFHRATRQSDLRVRVYSCENSSALWLDV